MILKRIVLQPEIISECSNIEKWARNIVRLICAIPQIKYLWLKYVAKAYAGNFLYLSYKKS